VNVWIVTICGDAGAASVALVVVIVDLAMSDHICEIIFFWIGIKFRVV